MRGAPQRDSFACNLKCPRKRPHALKLAECPLSEVPLYCVSQTGSNFLSVLRVREVSIFGGFFVQTLTGIVRDLRKCPFYRKCPPLGGVR